ncbi:MAG: energy-coupling factor transporter transmembrane component T [Bacillus sp. (in: firmicutes)]
MKTIGYIHHDTFIHKVNGATKLLAFIFLSLVTMITYDTRLLLTIGICSILLFPLSKIKWENISFVVLFIALFSLLNLIAVYLFAPEYGVELYQSRTVIWEGIGRYSLTKEQLFYEFNLVLKYCASIPIALLFLFTTNPSEFAASLYRIGVPYKIAYAVALALRYIPDIQEEYRTISYAQQARGFEISGKNNLWKKIKGTALILFPLIFLSLERIDVITNAMLLRRFGKNKKRSWYSEKPFTYRDILVFFFILIFISLLIICFYINNGRFYNPFLSS